MPNIRNATKLKKAAQMTACFGESTRVETIVETELAASCMPLVKSKTSAIAMIMMINIMVPDINRPPVKLNRAVAD